MDFISILSIFVLACFVGYYVVWSVTPALHTPLMAVTNAISSVIIVGALIAAAAAGSGTAKILGLVAVVLASINIFGGFAVTAKPPKMLMLAITTAASPSHLALALPAAALAINAPTMITEEMALVTAISGVCSAGVTDQTTK